MRKHRIKTAKPEGNPPTVSINPHLHHHYPRALADHLQTSPAIHQVTPNRVTEADHQRAKELYPNQEMTDGDIEMAKALGHT